MSERAKTVCFTCSLAVGEPLHLNHMANGQVCPACRDRVLDSLPPVLPARAGQSVHDLEGERSLYERDGDAGYGGDLSEDRGR